LDLQIPISSPKPETPEKDFSIIIAHRGNTLGLWATIHSCEVELAGSDFDYEYIVVTNGEESKYDELDLLIGFVAKSGKLGDHYYHPQPLSPPSARQLGSETASGRLLFFFDNHCIPCRHYFHRAIEQVNAHGIDILHSCVAYAIGEERYHYELSLEKNFWMCNESFAPVDPINPYQIAMAGHGGFVVRKSTWDVMEGYGPLLMFEGWGGEEPYFDLKAARMGFSVWLDPLLMHYHFPTAKRGYERHGSDDMLRNFMLAAYMIGGQWWLDTVYKSFSHEPKKPSPLSLSELRDLARARGESHRQWINRHSVRSLDEVLHEYRRNGII
jgi:hypothetical protein